MPVSDLFTDSISETLDDARTILSGIGLRPYRVFRLMERWDGGDLGAGVRTLEWNEILPYPKVDYNPRRVAAYGGSMEQGQVLVWKITRTLSREDLLGKRVNGANLPKGWRQHWVIAPLRAHVGNTYVPSGEPSLRSTEWRIPLRPTNKTFPMPSQDFTGL